MERLMNLSNAFLKHVQQQLIMSAGSGHCLTAAHDGSLTASFCNSQATTQSWSLLQNGSFAPLGQAAGLSLCSAGMLQCSSAAMQSVQGIGQLLAAPHLQNSSAQVWSLRRPGEVSSVLLAAAAAWGPHGSSSVPLQRPSEPSVAVCVIMATVERDIAVSNLTSTLPAPANATSALCSGDWYSHHHQPADIRRWGQHSAAQPVWPPHRGGLPFTGQRRLWHQRPG